MTAETTPAPGRLVNLRDVAASVPGLARDVLLRSDAPLLGDRHEGYPVAWPPRTIIDLRDAEERTGEHPLASLAFVHSLPLLSGRARDLATYPASLAELYLQMLQDPGAGHLVAAVEAIATGATPVLTHCAAGKDRTGVLIALTLALVGIDDDTIVLDYTLTAAAMAQVHTRLRTTHGHINDPEHKTGLPADFSDAPAEAISAVLSRWRADWGGARGWYLRHNGTAEILAVLQDRLRAR